MGNSVILKPAEQTPAVLAIRVFRIFSREAGVPESAIHFLPGAGEVVGARLVEHPDVATIVFTGSRDVGYLHRPEGTWQKRPLEWSDSSESSRRMGGKNAIVVDDDADFDAGRSRGSRLGLRLRWSRNVRPAAEPSSSVVRTNRFWKGSWKPQPRCSW